jgi:type II secretory pathway pseudopilin PulG
MKNIIVILLLFLGVSFSATIVNAQSEREQRKAERAECNKQEKQQLEANREKLLYLVEERQLVLEAHTLYDRRQNTYPVSPSTNFVAINGKTATIQIAFPGAIGRNGVGGVTIDGRVSSYEVSHKKRSAPITINAQVSSATLGNSTLTLKIYDNGTARASVRGSFGTEVSFAGNVVNFENTTVYKGTPDV